MQQAQKAPAVGALLVAAAAAAGVGAARAAPVDQTIPVSGAEYAFAPDQLYAAPGERLTVQFANIGQVPHDIVFELDGSRLARLEPVAPGQQRSLSFDAPAEPGRYSYYCSIGSHRTLGMSGTLRVEPPPPTPTDTPTATLAVTETPTATIAATLTPTPTPSPTGAAPPRQLVFLPRLEQKAPLH
jgi:plastocyanin